jgi:hypothetical protein
MRRVPQAFRPRHGWDSATARTALFVVGPDVWLANAERLGVDLAAIELVFLSHWHIDYSGGLATVPGRDRASTWGGRSLAACSRSASRSPASARHHAAHRQGHAVPLAPTLTSCPLMLMWIGMIARATSYETGLHGHVMISGTGRSPTTR